VAKQRKKAKKPEKLEFVQDFIPVKSLQHGIIETTDGRYIRILEIEPINFMLRSGEEQFNIISSFASWLKISPMRLQFKSMTRKADSDKHIAMIHEELEIEESEECRHLGDGYIRLIKDVGSREALTRRFFLIFQYEEIRRGDGDDFSQIYGMMQTAEQNARAYFLQCGNSILQPRDPDESTAEILYMFFNRQAGYFIKQGIANNNEDLFYISVFITVSARSYDELDWRKQQMVDMLKSMDMQVSDCRFQQEAALKSVMPFLHLDGSLERKSQRNVLTSGAASTYMFTSFEMSDDTGVLLGVNRHNNSLCIVDLFDTRKNKNANLNLLGTSGAGKTFTLQLLALRMRMRGIQCYILAPIKGHEFRRACNRIGGQYVKIAPGSPHCINVMEIRHTVSPEMELIDGDSGEEDSMLARKIQQLMIFFSLLIPDMTNEEEQMLDEALIKTYADFGITHDNDSLYLDAKASPPRMKKMPILGDLHKNLLENPMTKRVAIIVSRFVTGSAQSFNQQTNVDLSNKYIVLDLSELKGKLLPVGMMIALDYVWDNVKADRTKKKAIMIDEIWQLVGASSNKQAADFCLTIFKTIRGFGGAAISATQDLSDFFGLEDGKYGRAIINNSKNKIILNLEPDEARYVQEVLKLTKTETRSITRFERGEALVYSNNNKVPVVIKASREEQEMITTDRAELEAILKEKQRNTHKSGNA